MVDDVLIIFLSLSVQSGMPGLACCFKTRAKLKLFSLIPQNYSLFSALLLMICSTQPCYDAFENIRGENPNVYRVLPNELQSSRSSRWMTSMSGWRTSSRPRACMNADTVEKWIACFIFMDAKVRKICTPRLAIRFFLYDNHSVPADRSSLAPSRKSQSSGQRGRQG